MELASKEVVSRDQDSLVIERLILNELETGHRAVLRDCVVNGEELADYVSPER
jgi:hypothetical protein